MDDGSDEEQRNQIRYFLRDFKELMGEFQKYYVKNHLKNLEALSDLGITTRIRDDIIRSLKVDDYYAGPKPDQQHPGVYWEFGKKVAEVEAYIKLKIVISPNGAEHAICLSFHRAEYPLRYPLRKKEIE